MHDYYLTLLRAVENLGDVGAQSRRSLYERAQADLLGELARRMPRLSASQIDQENRRLAAAIRRIESGMSPAISETRSTRARNVLLEGLAAQKLRKRSPKEFSRETDHFVNELIELL